MIPKAVDQARERLRKATEAAARLEQANLFRDKMAAWTDFLIAASTIYSKLEQGSNGNGRSKGWFGRKKSERRKDALLRYLHFARNCDEHGLEEIAVHSSRDYGFDDEIAGRNLVVNPIGKPPGVYVLDDGPPITPAHTNERVRVVRVTDTRYGDFAEPPHQDVLELTKIALERLGAIVDEADALAQ